MARTPLKTPIVGRTPWSAADALVGLLDWRQNLDNGRSVPGAVGPTSWAPLVFIQIHAPPGGRIPRVCRVKNSLDAFRMRYQCRACGGNPLQVGKCAETSLGAANLSVRATCLIPFPLRAWIAPATSGVQSLVCPPGLRRPRQAPRHLRKTRPAKGERTGKRRRRLPVAWQSTVGAAHALEASVSRPTE